MYGLVRLQAQTFWLLLGNTNICAARLLLEMMLYMAWFPRPSSEV
jgi:hypothetical protein